MAGDTDSIGMVAGIRRTRAVRWFAIGPLIAVIVVAACAQPVRKTVKVDESVPVGRVEGDRFTGVRFPFTVSTAGTEWEVSTTYPPFLLEQGYEEEGLESTDLFVYDPQTRSSLQISFSPADAYSEYDQGSMEWLATFVAGSMEAELDHEFGKGNYTMTLGETEAYSLQGVPYAARNYARYEAKGVVRENGWVYAFAEPFQIFLLYQLNDLEHSDDRQELETILSQFRYTGPPE